MSDWIDVRITFGARGNKVSDKGNYGLQQPFVEVLDKSDPSIGITMKADHKWSAWVKADKKAEPKAETKAMPRGRKAKAKAAEAPGISADELATLRALMAKLS